MSQFLQFSIIFYFHPICFISLTFSLPISFPTLFLLVTGDSFFPPYGCFSIIFILLSFLFIVCSLTHTHHNTVSSPQFSISSSNVLEDFLTGVCFRLFKYSIIYTHLSSPPPSFPPPSTDEHTPLLPLRCIDSRLCTLSLATATRDINSRPSR